MYKSNPHNKQHKLIRPLQSGSMTSYAINCAPDTESDDCGLPPNGMTVIQGSSSVILSYDMSSM
jgi:hypothetical protein